MSLGHIPNFRASGSANGLLSLSGGEEEAMGFYANRVLPRLISLAMRHGGLGPYRRRVASGASGRVLEVGIGSGLNLPFYGCGVTHVIGLDPSERLLAMARSCADRVAAPLDLMSGSAQEIPLENASIDTAVMTWTLCSVADPVRVLREIRRVLRPGGSLFFVEHGQSPERHVRAWQDRLTPVWKRVAGNCHLNRDVPALLSGSGYEVPDCKAGYMPGPRPFTFMFEGRARPR